MVAKKFCNPPSFRLDQASKEIHAVFLLTRISDKVLFPTKTNWTSTIMQMNAKQKKKLNLIRKFQTLMSLKSIWTIHNIKCQILP